MTWNTAPGFLGGVVDEIGSVDDDTWQEFDITSLVRGDGIVSLRLRSDSSNRVDYATKEFSSALAPTLLVELAGGPDPSVSEAGAFDTYTIVLNSQPLGAATVTVTSDAQLSTTPAPITFHAGNWNIPQTVTVQAVDDGAIEGTHVGTIRHGVSGGGFSGVGVPDVAVQILDNDVADVLITESGGSTSVDEDGATDSYTIVLLARPSASVTIRVDPDGELRTDVGQVVFTPANWDVPRTVEVEAVDDDDEGTHSGRITHQAFGSGFDGVGIDAIRVTIADNDKVVVGQISLPFGLSLVGWFGTPTTARAILDGNSRIVTLWVWDSGRDRWSVDSAALPDSLRRTITIVIGDGFFVLTSRSTVLDVPLD